MRLCRTAVYVLVLALGAIPVHAADGVLIVQRVTTGGSTTSSQVQIAPDRMRAEVADPSGRVQVFVFDGRSQVMYLIDNERKEYTELTRADLERLGAQMQAALAQMQAQMANMPPAARAQMEAMLAGRGIALPAAAIEYRRAGTATVGQWTCARYEGYQANEKTSEVCTVEPDALGFTEEDFAVTRQMMEFVSVLVPQGADQLFAIGQPDQQGFSGVPVRQVTSTGGREATTEITEARRETFPDDLFAAPAGFQRRDFMPGGPGR